MTGDTFVMYRSYFVTYERLLKRNPQLAARFLDAIHRYAFNNDIPDENDELWCCGLDTIYKQMEAVNERFQKSINNKGGRPPLNISKEQIEELIEEYDTWNEIANQLQIEPDTLRKLRAEYNITGRTPAQNRKTLLENRKTEKPTPINRKTETEKPKNLNININNNINNNNNNNNSLAAARLEEDMSIEELNKYWNSEDIEYSIYDRKVTNLSENKVTHYLTEESYSRWQNYLKTIKLSVR